MAKRKRIKHDYEPPWGRPQFVDESVLVHPRWIAKLAAKLPDGVPPQEPITRCVACHVAVDTCCRKIHSAISPHCPLPGTEVDPPWPATFGDQDEDGIPIAHRADQGAGFCFQCGGCSRYIPLEGSHGSDWGACSHPLSEYDGRVVFEHWTCRYFDYGLSPKKQKREPRRDRTE